MPGLRRVRLDLILHVAVGLGLIWAAASFLSIENLAQAFNRLNLSLVLGVLGLGFTYTVLRGLIFSYIARSVTDLPSRLVLHAYLSAEATALLPGGTAARMALLNQVGVPLSRGLVPVLLVSALDQVFFGFVLIVAALLLPGVRGALVLLPVFVLLLTFLALPGARRLLGRLVRPLFARFSRELAWTHFEEALHGTLRARVLLVGFLLTSLAFALKVFILFLCLRDVGYVLRPDLLLFAFVLPTLAGRLSPFPGGAGVTEAGSVAFLSAFGGVRAEEALAATIVFRSATTFVPALAGGLIYSIAWRPTRGKGGF